MTVLPPGSPNPPSLAEDEGRASERKIPLPLESLLAWAANRAGPGGTILLERHRKGAVNTVFPSLSEKEASGLLEREGQGSRAWLLPFIPHERLEQDLDRALETISRSAALFRGAGLLPFFATLPFSFPGEGEPAVDTRLHPAYWGVLPGSRYGARVRARFRELMRLLFPERVFLFRMLENHALAGVDLYTESLMDRFGPSGPAFLPTPAGASRKGRPLVIGVCGMDGSGKSSHVSAIEVHLRAQGLRVKRHKIYRHGVFHDTVTDLTRSCGRDRNLHLWRIQRLIKLFDSLKYFYASVEEDLEDEEAVLLFDRYVFTHYAAGRGRLHHDPFALELLSPFPPADRIYLLDVSVDTALTRIGAREEKTVDENPYMLSRYRHLLLDLADRHGFVVLDGEAPMARNRARILEDVDALVRTWRDGRKA